MKRLLALVDAQDRAALLRLALWVMLAGGGLVGGAAALGAAVRAFRWMSGV